MLPLTTAVPHSVVARASRGSATDELHASNQYCFDMRPQQHLLILDCSVQRRALLRRLLQRQLTALRTNRFNNRSDRTIARTSTSEQEHLLRSDIHEQK